MQNKLKTEIMKIAIIVAMDKEFAQLAKLLDHATTTEHHGRTVVTGEMGRHTLILQQSGIGKVNAAICTVEMINRYKPELVISTGVAGGADPTLDVQNVVVGLSRCVLRRRQRLRSGAGHADTL